MKNNQSFDYKWSSISLWAIIIQYKYFLLILGTLAFAGSVLVSFLIPSTYKSTATVFPSARASVSQNIISNTTGYKTIMNFGEDEEVDYMMQILYADEIRLKVVEKFDLMQHYGINPNEKYAKTKLINYYANNIRFKRTEFMSIDIVVLDRDAQTSADIANYIVNLIDTVIHDITSEKAKRAFDIVNTEFIQYQNQIQILEDSLAKIRHLGVNDYKSQAEVYNETLARAIANGKRDGIKELEKRIAELGKYGNAYERISYQLNYLSAKFADLRIKWIEAKVDMEHNLPYKFVVNKAVVPEKRYTPVRWLVVFSGTVSSLFMALLVLLIFVNVKKVEKLD